MGWSSDDGMQFSGGMSKGGPSRIVQRARLSSEQPSDCTTRGQGQAAEECCAQRRLLRTTDGEGWGLQRTHFCKLVGFFGQSGEIAAVGYQISAL